MPVHQQVLSSLALSLLVCWGRPAPLTLPAYESWLQSSSQFCIHWCHVEIRQGGRIRTTETDKQSFPLWSLSLTIPQHTVTQVSPLSFISVSTILAQKPRSSLPQQVLPSLPAHPSAVRSPQGNRGELYKS